MPIETKTTTTKIQPMCSKKVVTVNNKTTYIPWYKVVKTTTITTKK